MNRKQRKAITNLRQLIAEIESGMVSDIKIKSISEKTRKSQGFIEGLVLGLLGGYITSVQVSTGFRIIDGLGTRPYWATWIITTIVILVAAVWTLTHSWD